MDLELGGKTAIVTGGSRGIGKAVAREMAVEGMDVVIAARSMEMLDSTAEELSYETKGRIFPVQVDTTEDESVRSMVQQSLGLLGHVDVLVNCAARPLGQGSEPDPLDITDDYFWNDINVKCIGYFRCIRAVVPDMKSRGWGRIINISGLGARNVGSLTGSVRNVAIVAMTKNLAAELGRDGINVTVVHPGYTRTEATPRVIADLAISNGISEKEAEKQIALKNPLGRIIDSREIGYIVTFLASPKSVAINGDVIAAGGGAGTSIHY